MKIYQIDSSDEILQEQKTMTYISESTFSLQECVGRSGKNTNVHNRALTGQQMMGGVPTLEDQMNEPQNSVFGSFK